LNQTIVGKAPASRRWISAHIFYSSDPTPLLIECIAPLVDKLRAEDFISRYFFIRYWLAGPHVRLRLSPREAISCGDVKAIVEEAIRSYLARRPSLFDLDQKALVPFYRRMFEVEYGRDAFTAKYGEDGEIPLYPNNSVRYFEYEPEYARYGGEHGIEVAEKHFEVSSDIVLQLLQSATGETRSILLGHALHLMLTMCYGFMETDENASSFLYKYEEHWRRQYKEAIQRKEVFESKYVAMAEKLRRRVSRVRRLSDDPSGYSTEIERRWAAHVKDLKTSIRELAKTRRLEMPPVAEGEQAALRFLLTNYLHMTNNRMGVTISDEVYLSYLLRRAIEDSQVRELDEAIIDKP